MATALVALATTTLASASATVTFGGIPGGFRDLRLVINATVASGGGEVMYWRLNSDTGANYNYVQMDGNGSTTSSTSSANQTIQEIGRFYATPTVVTMDILDYSATDKHKTALSRTSGAANVVAALAARWASTAVVTSITLSTSGANFAAGSTFSLYGIVS